MESSWLAQVKNPKMRELLRRSKEELDKGNYEESSNLSNEAIRCLYAELQDSLPLNFIEFYESIMLSVRGMGNWDGAEGFSRMLSRRKETTSRKSLPEQGASRVLRKKLESSWKEAQSKELKPGEENAKRIFDLARKAIVSTSKWAATHRSLMKGGYGLGISILDRTLVQDKGTIATGNWGLRTVSVSYGRLARVAFAWSKELKVDLDTILIELLSEIPIHELLHVLGEVDHVPRRRLSPDTPAKGYSEKAFARIVQEMGHPWTARYLALHGQEVTLD